MNTVNNRKVEPTWLHHVPNTECNFSVCLSSDFLILSHPLSLTASVLSPRLYLDLPLNLRYLPGTAVPNAYITHMQSPWVQALSWQAGEEGAPVRDTPFLNKWLCLSLTYQRVQEVNLKPWSWKKQNGRQPLIAGSAAEFPEKFGFGACCQSKVQTERGETPKRDGPLLSLSG